MSQAANGVSYERTNPGKYCTRCDIGVRSANRAGCGIREDTASTSPVSRSRRTVARSRICLDGRLLEVGRGTQGEKRIRVGAGQVETPAAFRCSLGFTKLALQPGRLPSLGAAGATTQISRRVTAAALSSPRRLMERMTALRIWDFRLVTTTTIVPARCRVAYVESSFQPRWNSTTSRRRSASSFWSSGLPC
jgi:hypothetical protein